MSEQGNDCTIDRPQFVQNGIYGRGGLRSWSRKRILATHQQLRAHTRKGRRGGTYRSSGQDV